MKNKSAVKGLGEKGKIEAEFKNDPIDQIGLDLGFMKAVIDLLGSQTERGCDVELIGGSLTALCYEMQFKMESIRRNVEKLYAASSPAK